MRPVLLALALLSCSDGPDLVPTAKPAAQVVTGCAPPVDAGAPDALDCTCPDKHGNCAIPACGIICCW